MCTAAALKGNVLRGPLNALFFETFEDYLNRLLDERKARLFADLPARIVEIGSGVGANFRYLKKGTTVTAVEPNPHMYGGLRKKARRNSIRLDILASGAEAIDLPENSVDAVICTLVLCTVNNPERVIAEVRRILKPGGRFMFIEHVVAPKKSGRRFLQNVLHRPWRYMFEGCNTNRDTKALLNEGGFSALDIEEYVMKSPFLPVNLQIAGVATA